MGQVIQTNGDYIIKANTNSEIGGKIVLDTGENVGNVLVTGNLIVQGETLTVSADNLNVEDNIIIINYYGEDRTNVPAGVVPSGFAGIEIDRGSLPSAAFIWNDNINSWLLGTGTDGNYNFSDSRLILKEILTNSITDNGDLLLIGTGNGVIKVREPGDNGEEYRLNVIDPNHIPNKKYVDDAIINQPSFQIIADVGGTATRVIASDADLPENQPGSIKFLEDQTNFKTEDDRSAISIIVDGALSAQFYDNKTLFGKPGVNGIEIDGINFEIRTQTSITNQNIFIKTAGTGRLQTNYAFQLDHIATSPAPPFVLDSENNPQLISTTIIHGKTPDLGTTGVWFVNNSATPRYRSGELISKNKALVFSMIF